MKTEETDSLGRRTNYFVTRKPVTDLSKSELGQIRDDDVREIVKTWVEQRGGVPKRAFPPYPKRGPKGPEIRNVRLQMKQQKKLMAKVSTGYAGLGNNHHIAIYRQPNGAADYEVVSLLEASRRLARRESVVCRNRGDGSAFVMSLAQGDVVELQDEKEKRLWVVHGISAEGRPTLASLNDARPTSAAQARKRKIDGTRKNFEPRFGGFMRREPKKLSVDPIGRMRPAND